MPELAPCAMGTLTSRIPCAPHAVCVGLAALVGHEHREQLIEEGRNLIYQEVIRQSNEDESYNPWQEEIIVHCLNELY